MRNQDEVQNIQAVQTCSMHSMHFRPIFSRKQVGQEKSPGKKWNGVEWRGKALLHVQALPAKEMDRPR